MSHERLWPKHPNVELSVDLLEGELDLEFEKDLETWLNSSEGNQSCIKEELEILSQVRQSLKDSDDVAVPESGLYYDALEARIMGALDQAIEAGEVADKAVGKAVGKATSVTTEAVSASLAAASRGRPVRRGMATRAGHLAVLAGLALLVTGKWPLSVDGAAPRSGARSGSEMLEATRSAAPAVLANTIMSLESDSDLAIELAARENVARRMIAMNLQDSESSLAD